MRKILAVLVLIGASVGLGSPAQAAPPNDFGNSCLANNAPANTTALMTAKSGANPLPIAAPITGVITKATFALPAIGTTISTVVKTLRSTGALNQYAVIAESAAIPVGGGTQTYNVQVPVTAGDLLGLGSSLGTLECSTPNAGDVIGVAAGNFGPGQTATFTPQTSYALPVVATIEPDADKDGFGDVTQDLCPQSASFQGACPVIVLDSFAAASGGSITVVVATDNRANVKVTGKAKVNGKTIKLKGGTKLVTPGALTKFKVKLPKSLRSALAALPPSKRIKVTLTATSTDLVGRVSTDKSNVKLPGTH